jgi:hypothetical protein
LPQRLLLMQLQPKQPPMPLRKLLRKKILQPV